MEKLGKHYAFEVCAAVFDVVQVDMRNASTFCAVVRKEETVERRIEKVRQRFVSDTKKHEIVILNDAGPHRHLSFGKPGSVCMRVDVVTWPGYLAYVGDMGAFVFSRIEDMFVFFRGSRVNPSYWAEKVQAADRDKVKQWSRELFLERAQEDLAALVAEDDDGRYEGIEDKFAEEVLSGLDDMQQERAYQAIIDFEHNGRYPFQDWWEVDTHVFTHRFLWCCFALVRIIALYDSERR